MNGNPLHNAMLDVIEQALREDIGLGDITTECIVPPDLPGTGTLIAKANGVLSGVDIAEMVFKSVDPDIDVDTRLRNGMPLLRGSTSAVVKGPFASLLTAERTALNFMQRMSGIATATSAYLKLIEGCDVKLLDTRKTAPCLRPFDKQAVRDGHGMNHRYGLDDMVLIKDNHIAAAGSITDAVTLVRARLPKDTNLKVEVETESMAQVFEALSCEGIDIVMLDNFSIDDMAQAVRIIRMRKPELKIEASGNVNEHTIRDIAETGVDMISVGALTHSVKALDISFEIEFDES
jgi:nicotinate-nucleotide pyrophosphorylase (carboxylating)